MGFLDDVQASLNRGVAGANRGVESMRLKSQMSDAMRRRQQLAAQLGASLYEATKDIPEFRAGREQLFDGIAQIDAERVSIQAQLDELERQAAQSAQTATAIDCPFCHTRISASDLFCSGCGKPMAEIQAALHADSPVTGSAAASSSQASSGEDALSANPVCPICGAPVGAGDAFCMSCGAKLGA